MDEKIKLAVKGDVYISIGKALPLYLHNDIQPEAGDIVRRCIAIEAPLISKIKILNGNLVQTTIPVMASFPLGAPNAVKFSAIAEEDSFEGDFNGLHLLTSNDLPFSKLLDFAPITKTQDNQITIEWVLTIEIITV
jgi:hypothetical protein